MGNAGERIRYRTYLAPEDAALAQLCQTYWYPLYAFVRRGGATHHDAEDLTQAFFAKLLEKNYLGDASRERGRFRTFLLASLKHFLANEWDKRSAKKRGGRNRLHSARCRRFRSLRARGRGYFAAVHRGGSLRPAMGTHRP